MTTQPLEQWPKWRDDLILRLRMKDVPGETIGDILFEADAHLRETGERPEDAFGSPKAYATERAMIVPERHRSTGNRMRLVLIALVGGFTGFLAASSAWSLGSGSDLYLGIPAWLGLAVAFAVAALFIPRLPVDLIRDPRTGRSIHGGRGSTIAIMGGSLAVASAVLIVLGWIAAR